MGHGWGIAPPFNQMPPLLHHRKCESFAFSPSLFHDFLTGQTTQSVLSRSGQTPCIETSRGALGRERRRRPSNCHENVRTNVFDREKILTTSLNNLVRGCKVMGYVFSRVYKKIGFSWSRKINVGRRCYKDIV